MGLNVRKTPDAITFALAQQFNALKRDLATANTKVHADITAGTLGGDYRAPTATAIAATGTGDATLATLIANCQSLYDTYTKHLADTLAHKVAMTPAGGVVRMTSTNTLADCEAFLNALHTDYGTHIGSTTYHYTADGTNTDASVAATDQASSDTRQGALKTALNAHVQMAMTTMSLTLVDP